MVMFMYRRLKDLRNDSDLSQKELGEFIGVPQRTYSYYENGLVSQKTKNEYTENYLYLNLFF